MPIPEPPCAHDWSRSLSDPFTVICMECRERYDSDRHNPAVPDSDPPIRSFDDWEIVLHEQQREAA